METPCPFKPSPLGCRRRERTETGVRASAGDAGGSLRGFASWGLRGGLFWRLGSFCGLGEEMRVVMWTFSLKKSTNNVCCVSLVLRACDLCVLGHMYILNLTCTILFTSMCQNIIIDCFVQLSNNMFELIFPDCRVI